MHDSHDEAKIQEQLNRFIEYAQSPDIYFRNLVGWNALETLPIVASSPKDVATVLELLSTVAVDTEVDARCNVLEYIVHIALLLSDPKKSCETLKSFITSHILPIIVTALLDSDPKVVKLADCALIALLEHCLVPNGYVQERIWPAIVKNMYDQSTTNPIIRVITLMSKMVPWVPCGTTKTLFIPLFIQLCSYPDIIPRKACASIIGDFCAVVPLETVETKLVPSFLTLCSDSVWIVRKTCAEVFTSVSSAASAYTRKHHLAPAFATLLTDPFIYVRSAAFQSLGPFITTFAEPSITNLEYNHQGKLVLRHPDGFEFQFNSNIELNNAEKLQIDESSELNHQYFYKDDVYYEEEDEVKTVLGTEDDKDARSNLDNKLSETNSTDEDNSTKSDHGKLNHARRHLNFEPSDKENRIDVTRKDDINYESGWKKVMDSSDNENWNYEENKDDAREKKWTEEENNLKFENEKSEVEDSEEGSNDVFYPENNLSLELLNENESNEPSSDSSESQTNKQNPIKYNQIIEDKNEKINNVDEYEDDEEQTSESCETVENDFNGFVFWRDPVPDIEIDITLARLYEERKKLVGACPETSDYSCTPLSKIKRRRNRSKSHCRLPVMPGSPGLIENEDPRWKHFDDNLSPLEKYDFTKQKNQLFLAFMQHIEASNFTDVGSSSENTRGASVVPDDLIFHFVSMSSPREDKKQNDLAHHCAYNLPAVALTLGPENWALIKQACNSLATDQQWRVRRIVASSIHELAVIVGTDVATEDLVPVFTGFIKDLDEVRIGALKHLANFLKLLKPSVRNTLLPRLAEFLITDYEWNWRFRAKLAEQLLLIVKLFTPEDVSVHLAPVAFTLLQDKVAHVRSIAVQLVVEIIGAIAKEGVLVRSAVAELAEQFAHSSRWCRRQTFAHLCSSLVEHEALPLDMFARDILPHLLDLSWDKVANVRLSVARTLSRHIMALDMFSNPSSPHNEVVVIVIKRLQSDKDRDVRFFATLPAESDNTNPQLPESSNIDSNRLEDENDLSR